MDPTSTSVASVGYAGPRLWEYLQIAVFAILGILVLIFNFFVFAVLKCGRGMFDDVTVIMFRSLATTDIATGLSVAILEGIIFYVNDFLTSDIICACMPAVSSLMMLSTMIHVCLMNLQRYVAISYPFTYMRLATAKRVFILMCAIKLFLVLGAMPMLPLPGFPATELFQLLCETRSFSAIISTGTSLFMKVFMISFCVICCILVAMITLINGRLLVLAYRMRTKGNARRLPQPNMRGNAQENAVKERKRRSFTKGLKTVFIITFLFYVSTAPILLMMGVVLHQPPWSETTYNILFFLGIAITISSNWWNVPVYMVTSASFRQRALLLLRRRRSACGRKNFPESSTTVDTKS